jgi:hypothetical protein
MPHCLLPTRNRRDRAVVPSSRRGKSGLFVRVQFGDAGRGSSIVAPQAAQSTTFWQLSPQSSGPIDSADHSKNLGEPPICHLTELSCSLCWSREHSKIQPVGTPPPAPDTAADQMLPPELDADRRARAHRQEVGRPASPFRISRPAW